jgi:hypothetical protein
MDGLVGFMSREKLELEMVVECMVSGGRVKVGRFRAALGVVVCLGREGLWIWDWFFSVVVVPWERGSLVAFRYWMGWSIVGYVVGINGEVYCKQALKTQDW